MADFFNDSTKISKLKMALIAGASEALKSRATDPRKSDQEILQEIIHNAPNLISNID